MAGPKTVEEARALPEVGIIELGRYACNSDTDEDYILYFIDSNDESKMVHCLRRTRNGPNEWVKAPL